MKRMIALVVALMVCAALVLPAAASTFTPSVTYKDAPQIVPVPGVTDPEGNPALGEIWKDDIFFEYLYDGCLVITSVAEAQTSTQIPEDAKNLLLEVYEKLSNGEMKLPYEKLGLNPDNMVIRDLFDATFLCGNDHYAVNHPEMLEPEGTVIKLTFDIGVDASEKVYTMTYKQGEWNPIVETVNNGDGTVTCTFEKLCPVVFCVETADEGGDDEGGSGNKPGDDDDDENSKTGDESITLWIVTASVSLVAIVALVVIYRSKFSKKS